MFEKEEKPIDNSIYSEFAGVTFKNGQKAYFFGLTNLQVNVDDKVVVETARGLEIGVITIAPMSMKKYKSPLGLKPIIRKATDVDLKMKEMNEKDAKFALEVCKSEAERLKLDMNLISCEYTLDKSKVMFSYLADDRVDFRELLKILASKFHIRIELKQIGSRDKAKMIGGLGICGLPLCCSTFLNEFDGISITRAKNQMLAINIPKLSGQCGKLICCLKYEDEAYLEQRKLYPELGSKLFIGKEEFTVTGVNILSQIIKIENEEDVKFIPFEDLKKQANFVKNKERPNFRQNDQHEKN